MLLFIRFIIVTTLMFLLVGFILSRQADAHDWYDYACCSDKDCRPIPFDHVVITPDGYVVRPPGAIDATLIPFGDRKIRPTPPEDLEQRYHVCTSGGTPNGTVLCLYVPQGGV